MQCSDTFLNRLSGPRLSAAQSGMERLAYSDELDLRNTRVGLIGSEGVLREAKCASALDFPRNETNAAQHNYTQAVMLELQRDKDVYLHSRVEDMNKLYEALK